MCVKRESGEVMVMSKGVMLLQDQDSVPWLPKEVQQFAWDMARKLKCNEPKGGWDELTVGELFGLLEDELAELADTIMNGTADDVIDEAADVANFAMMIADLCRKRTEVRNVKP